MSDIPQAEIDAQQWHDEQVREDPDHERTCWCCCWSCDPDAAGPQGNPHFKRAQTAMAASMAAERESQREP